MAYGLTFTLELEDGTPADPPTFLSAPKSYGRPATRSPMGNRHCAYSASVTTTRINRWHWSLRTCPDRPLAPLADRECRTGDPL